MGKPCRFIRVAVRVESNKRVSFPESGRGQGHVGADIFRCECLREVSVQSLKKGTTSLFFASF